MDKRSASQAAVLPIRIEAAMKTDDTDEPIVGAKTSLREEQKRLTRKRLIESATGLFSERGWETTIDDIVKGAGASRGTFYLYFESKGSIIDEIMRSSWLQDLTEHFDRLMHEVDARDLASLRSWIARYLDLYEAYAGVIRAWLHAMQEDSSLTQSADELMKYNVTRMGDAIHAFRRTVGVRTPAVPDPFMATALVLQLERICFYSFIRHWRMDADTAGKLAAMWQSTILSP